MLGYRAADKQIVMSKKTSDESDFWKVMGRIAIIATIISAIVAVLAMIISNPYDKLNKKTEKGLVSIQQKCDASTTAINGLNPTEVPQEVMQIHRTMMDLSSEYQLVNKYIKHKKEVSRRRYLKSLSTVELVKLTMSEGEVSSTLIREALTPSFLKINEPFNQPDEKASAIQKMNYQKVYDKNKVLLEELLGWQTEKEKIGVDLNNYVKTLNPIKIQNKPDRKLFKICKKSIYAKKEVEFLKEWSDYVEMYIDYLSELQDYYIQNQSNKKLN